MPSDQFLFSTWSDGCLQIAAKLLLLLCKCGAGLYFVNYPKNQTMKQVRVGWPNPTTKSRRHILAIIEPLSEGKVRLELRVGQKSGLISENGRLEQAPRDTSKENDPSQKDKGYITLLPDADLPDGIEGWIKTALEFAKHAYGLATQS